MAYSKFTFIGYVKKVQTIESSNSGLKVTLSVPTGDRKKEGEQYNPSNLVQAALWGKTAEALDGVVEVGQTVLVDGRLGQPYLYVDDEGNPKAIQQITWVNDFRIMSSNDDKAEEEAPARRASAAKAKSVPAAAAKKRKPTFEDDSFDDDLEDDTFQDIEFE